MSDLLPVPYELWAGLQHAAENSGANGVHNFIERAESTDEHSPGLARLRELVNAQQTAIGADLPAILGGIYASG